MLLQQLPYGSDWDQETKVQLQRWLNYGGGRYERFFVHMYRYRLANV